MREVELINSDKKAVVDDADFDRVSAFQWLLLKNGYVMSNSRERYYLHRFILGISSKTRVDHRDRDKLHNWQSNLRAATNSQNQANAIKQSTYQGQSTSSVYKGVSWYARYAKWRAYIAGKHLGYFQTDIQAAKAYNDAALKMFGDFSLLNQI